MKEELESLSGFDVIGKDNKYYLWDDVFMRYVDKEFNTKEEALNWVKEKFM